MFELVLLAAFFTCVLSIFIPDLRVITKTMFSVIGLLVMAWVALISVPH